MGAQILRFTPATGISRENGEWIVHTEKGDIRCEYVVNAAGYYAQRVGEWFKPYGGRTVPMMVMSHQYLLSEEVPEIETYTKETGHKLPSTTRCRQQLLPASGKARLQPGAPMSATARVTG